MNKQAMRHWRDSLREAHRTGVAQTNGVLNRLKIDIADRTPGFCCLGIWMEIAADSGRVQRSTDGGSPCMYYIEKAAGTEDIREAEALTPGETDYLDLDSSDPILLNTRNADRVSLIAHDGAPLVHTASALNDSLKLTFDEIADCMTWTYNLDGEDE